jgi:hypothetical protein
MLLREDSRGLLAIGQASHAWISGQLARAWGNSQFGELEPFEEVVLAAEQHDVGMAAWDLDAALDPDTGLPYSFMEMPLDLHVDLWMAGPRTLVTQSRYAALLVSMHGWRLYARRDLEQLERWEAEVIRGFLDAQQALQEEMLRALRDDPVTAPAADPATVARNSQLIWTWDFMSLVLCLNWAPRTAHDVPTADGAVELEMKPAGSPHRVSVDPWPFSSATLPVHCDARRLEQRYEDERALHQALATARWETLELELVPV